MPQQIINNGTTAGDGTGENLHDSFDKVNSNFTEVYSDVETNTTSIAGKEDAFSKNTAFNQNFGTGATDVCTGNDSRLSDARTPTAHTHTLSEITDSGTLASQDNVSVSDINATGTADGTTFLRGDGQWATPAGGGGGTTPAIFYALGSGSANLGTTLGPVPLAAAIKSDTGYTFGDNDVTIGSELNGKWAQVTWAVGGTGATNRVEIRSELQVNTVRVKGTANYTARNGSQNTGGVQGFHLLQLSTGDVLRIQALRDGSNANLRADETHLYIQTLD